jgi:exosome complex RNA-binding protein Csl4
MLACYVPVVGSAMVPVSWTEMQCPKTFIKEPRKVAKVVPETVD